MDYKYFILIFTFCLSLQAAEVDQFTNRNTKLEDSTNELNDSVNSKIKKVIRKINRDGPTYRLKDGNTTKCHTKNLIDILEDKLDTEPSSDVESELYQSSFFGRMFDDDNNDTDQIPYSESIYQDIGYFDSSLMASGRACCSKIVKINGVLLGTDKISHFFTHGKVYYDVYKDFKNNGAGEELATDAAFLVGEEKEEGFWGKYSTGVSSYGDRAANYGGFRFWKELLRGENPIIKCHKKRWVINRDFKFEDYVTDGWDEAINCSEYKNDSYKNKVDQALNRLSIKEGREIKCPISPKRCIDLKIHYGEYAKKILHKDCYNADIKAITTINNEPSPKNLKVNERKQEKHQNILNSEEQDKGASIEK